MRSSATSLARPRAPSRLTSCSVLASVFIKNMDDFVAFNAVYARFFGESKPARSTVEVARLPKDALVEIEVRPVSRPAIPARQATCTDHLSCHHLRSLQTIAITE